MDQMKDTQELTMNTKNSRAVRLLADHPLGANSAAELEFFKVNPSLPFPDHPNQPRESYQIIGKDEESPGDAIPTNLWPQTH
jgi:hypothetical protein